MSERVLHFRCKIRWFKCAFYFSIALTIWHPCRSDIIAKSRITMCENTGQGEDPYNVVMGKNCEKKMIVSMSVYGGQVGEMNLYFLKRLNLQATQIWNS